jgi:nitrate reductase NapE component
MLGNLWEVCLCVVVFSCVLGVFCVGMVGSTGGFVWMVIVHSGCGVDGTASRTAQSRTSVLFVW